MRNDEKSVSSQSAHFITSAFSLLIHHFSFNNL